MALPPVHLVGHLPELDHQVGIDVAWGLVSLLPEDELAAFREARLDLNLLDLGLSSACFSVMLDDLALVLYLLDGAIVELLERAVHCDDYIAGCTGSRLVQTAKAISEDARLGVSAVERPVIPNEISRLEHLLEVVLRVYLHKVTASNFL